MITNSQHQLCGIGLDIIKMGFHCGAKLSLMVTSICGFFAEGFLRSKVLAQCISIYWILLAMTDVSTAFRPVLHGVRFGIGYSRVTPKQSEYAADVGWLHRCLHQEECCRPRGFLGFLRRGFSSREAVLLHTAKWFGICAERYVRQNGIFLAISCTTGTSVRGANLNLLVCSSEF